MRYCLITETRKIVPKTSYEHVTRDGYLKPDIESRIDDFNKKLMEELYDEIFQVNSNVDGNFDFILPDKYLRKTYVLNMLAALCLRMKSMMT